MIEWLIWCDAMNCRCEDMFQEGVARPAAFSSSARNQEGMGLRGPLVSSLKLE
jgi:hypothetical protein